MATATTRMAVGMVASSRSVGTEWFVRASSLRERMVGCHGDVAVQRTVEALYALEQSLCQRNGCGISGAQSCAGLGQCRVVQIVHRVAAVQGLFSTVYL